MDTENGKIKIKKIDESDFRFRKMQLEDYLHSIDLYQPLTREKSEDMFDAY